MSSHDRCLRCANHDGEEFTGRLPITYLSLKFASAWAAGEGAAGLCGASTQSSPSCTTRITAAAALERFVHRLQKAGTKVYFAGVRPHVRRSFKLPGLRGRAVHYVANVERALKAVEARHEA